MFEFLDKVNRPAPFQEPSLQCGKYEIVSEFGATYAYSLRRMPRRKGFEGLFGFFWHSDDAGEVLLMVWDAQKSSFVLINELVEYQRASKLLQKLVNGNPTHPNEPRCNWCGRKITPDDELKRGMHVRCVNKAGCKL